MSARHPELALVSREARRPRVRAGWYFRLVAVDPAADHSTDRSDMRRVMLHKQLAALTPGTVVVGAAVLVE